MGKPPATPPNERQRPRMPIPVGRRGDDDKGPKWRVERGAPSDKQAAAGTGKPEPPKRPRLRTYLWIIAGLFALNFILSQLFYPAPEQPRISYSPVFLQQVDRGNVKEISSRGASVTGKFKKKTKVPGADDAVDRFETELPAFVDGDKLEAQLRAKGVVLNAKAPNSGRGILATLLFGFGPTILLIALFVWFFRRAAGGGGNPLGQFGRSRARRVEATAERVSFGDVAGIDEAKEELAEIVDFLKNPEKYQKLGGRIPRGVLLSGLPGTGKTLLARAVAGEAGAPFFSMSASEFIEAIVGVGASRVRDLFKQAKEAAPAIIFIDELDAIGRSRTSAGGFTGGSDEREQTLNQILTEMDGFERSDSVIVLGATNRPEILDAALLRPGRFDRRVAVMPPDTVGRRKILEVHTRSMPLADDVDLASIAASSPGMVGADLANLCNEAALLAARRGHDKVQGEDFSDAMEKIVLGAERKVVMSLKDRERTAFHESGHAVVGMLTPGADPVRKVSIIPRGQALGVTFSAPDADRFNYTRDELLAKIKVSLGGRAAEEVVYGDMTTGAESDFQQVTNIARGMVGRWGMSEKLGPLTLLPSEPSSPLLPGAAETSERTRELIDEEVREIVDTAYDEVIELLKGNRERLEGLSKTLLERETVDQREAYEAAGMPVPERGTVDSPSA